MGGVYCEGCMWPWEPHEMNSDVGRVVANEEDLSRRVKPRVSTLALPVFVCFLLFPWLHILILSYWFHDHLRHRQTAQQRKSATGEYATKGSGAGTAATMGVGICGCSNAGERFESRAWDKQLG